MVKAKLHTLAELLCVPKIKSIFPFNLVTPSISVRVFLREGIYNDLYTGWGVIDDRFLCRAAIIDGRFLRRAAMIDGRFLREK